MHAYTFLICVIERNARIKRFYIIPLYLYLFTLHLARRECFQRHFTNDKTLSTVDQNNFDCISRSYTLFWRLSLKRFYTTSSLLQFITQHNPKQALFSVEFIYCTQTALIVFSSVWFLNGIYLLKSSASCFIDHIVWRKRHALSI